MKEIEKIITPLIDNQFPSFYKEEGPLFVLFLKEYYNWLSTKTFNINGVNVAGQSLYHARSLPDYRDVDKTVEEYLIYFKEKYLKGIDFDTQASKRTLIKAAQDLFRSKGSELSIDLLFSLLYGVSIEIYTPGDNILKLSQGTWYIPRYLEVVPTTKSKTMSGKYITGSKSRATAFVEYVIQRNVNGKILDLLFLSGIEGTFEVEEFVTSDEIIENAPKVSGSFNSLDITVSGQGFTVGEEVVITSATGIDGRAIVTGVETQTGKVTFILADGGWGYSVNATTLVSEKLISVKNKSNANAEITDFLRYESVEQNNYSVALNNVTGNFRVGSIVTNPDGANSVIAAKTQDLNSNTATIIITPLNGTTFSNTIVFDTTEAFIATNNSITFSLGVAVRQSNGSSNTNIGTVSESSNVTILTINDTTISSNGLHVGTYVTQSTSLATGKLLAVPRESNFGYTNVGTIIVGNVSGTFTSTDTLNFYNYANNDTFLAAATPTAVEVGYLYRLSDTQGTSVWSTGNTVLLSGNPNVNTTIKVASIIGGKYISNTSQKATGLVVGTTSDTVGLYNVGTYDFYGTGINKIYGITSNTFANCMSVSTGTFADFNVGSISDTETILIYPDRMAGNNYVISSPSSNVPFSSMLLTGANSLYGNLHSVLIVSGGTGYSNTDKIVFSGGNTGVGSYTAGNASITTNGSGNITTVTLSANTGNLITTTPTITIANSTGGASTGSGAELYPALPYGFQKLPYGDLNSTLIDALRFESKEIGSISSLTGINPGENYNIAPLISVIEPDVAAYGKRDSILNINNLTLNIGFTVGEVIEQTLTNPAVSVVSNNFSGNTTASYDTGEYVTTNNGISITGTGIVFSSTLNGTTGDYTTILTSNTGSFSNTLSTSKLTVGTNTGFVTGATATQGSVSGTILASNSTTLIIKNVTGGSFVVSGANVVSGAVNTAITAAVNSFKVYQLLGSSTKGLTDIKNEVVTTTNVIARGKVKSGSNTSLLYVKRTNLFNDFARNKTIVGRTSGEVATVTNESTDYNSRIIGDNATVTSSVVASGGAVSSLRVYDSGLSYVQDQTATFTSTDGTRVGEGKVTLSGIGVGQGRYTDTNGFLDDTYYIHDGEYYQEYSYEIRGSKPLVTYAEILKNVLHVAGTRLYGKVQTSTTANVSASAAESSITLS